MTDRESLMGLHEGGLVLYAVACPQCLSCGFHIDKERVMRFMVEPWQIGEPVIYDEDSQGRPILILGWGQFQHDCILFPAVSGDT